MPRNPRIAIDPGVLRALRAWAAREGEEPDVLASEVLRAALPPEVAKFAGLGGDEEKLLGPANLCPPEAQSREAPEPPRPAPAAVESPESRRTAPAEVAARKGRPWKGGPPPFEEQHPEIATRVMELWAGGKRAGGLSRDAVAAKMQSEGIQIEASQVEKIIQRSRKKDK